MKERNVGFKYEEIRWVKITSDVVELFFGDSYSQPMEAIELLPNGRYNLYMVTGPILRNPAGRPIAVMMLDRNKDSSEIYYYFDAWQIPGSEVYLNVRVPNESFCYWT